MTWNCNGGFWRKYTHLEQFAADVLVIQECNDPAQSKDNAYRKWAGQNYAWIGHSANKGLGVFSRTDRGLTKLASVQSQRFFLPVRIGEITVCGVWAHKAHDGSLHYCGQTHSYLSPPPDWLSDPLCIFLGDMNSSAIWDRPNRVWNHSASVKILNESGLTSAYHHQHAVLQGAEIHPSFYLHRSGQKPYHIDYIFHGRGWATQHCEIGSPDQWLEHSDHMPVVADLTLT
ncbi:endonuclease/exonuclease/phosphatase family protein [Cypionkella aquatica]|uniref:endonuclease/exonuclease/phosphatase family protein n=1 Tax=Cypionkella aquatica TaxID=1756042 RepID=UPI0024E11E45|nr:endonuclease/exonuclease/phosphatase family protein [Cypionkella aquatica]